MISDFEVRGESSQLFLMLNIFNYSWVPSSCDNEHRILVFKLNIRIFRGPLHEVGASFESEWNILFPLIPIQRCQKVRGLGDLASKKVLDGAVEVGTLIKNFQVDGWVKNLWEVLCDPSTLVLC